MSETTGHGAKQSRGAWWLAAVIVVGCATSEEIAGPGGDYPGFGVDGGFGAGGTDGIGGTPAAGGGGGVLANGGGGAAGGVIGGGGGLGMGGAFMMTGGMGGWVSAGGSWLGGGGAVGAGGDPACPTGSKRCTGACISPGPDVGCSATACDPCPSVANSVAVCSATGSCDVQCDPGFQRAGATCEPICDDGVRSGSETDIDCGGSVCGPCDDRRACSAPSDCVSGVCTGNRCQAPACDDRVQNGTETGVDCGAACGPCGLGGGCDSGAGCTTGRCVHNVCVPPLAGLCAGADHACVISDGGRVLCWGDGSSGELGLGSNFDYRAGPGYVSGLTDATQLACGVRGGHTCALRATGDVVCWGENGSGQLGDGTTSDRPSPVPVAGLAGVAQIAAGRLSSCALLANGQVRCWGAGSEGRLGTGSNADSRTPVTVVAGETGAGDLVSVSYIAAGAEHACAVLDRYRDQRVVCWGDGDNGRLGDDASSSRNSPVLVHGLEGTGACTAQDSSGCLRDVGAVAAGDNVTLVIQSGGLLSSFGDNYVGEAGTGSASEVPRRVTGVSGSGTLDDATWISMGQNHGCAVRASGAAVCWGEDDNGRLGDDDGQNGNEAAPSTVQDTAAYREVAAGDAFTCGLRSDGTVRCWGYNGQGQLGEGTFSERLRPVTVGGLRGIAEADAGFDHGCAVNRDGALYCWGTNANGHLGLGDSDERLTPVLVPTITTAEDVAGLQYGTCALLASGGVQCWGYDAEGQNGDGQAGNPTNRQVPVAVTGISNAVEITAGRLHACALVDPAPQGDSATEVWCWGYNGYGNLGDDSSTNRATPVRVRGVDGVGFLSDAVAVGAGWDHTCAVRATGNVVCWGNNGAGRLGDGSQTNRDTPVTVKGAGGVGDLTGMRGGRHVIDGGGDHTCAVAAAGTVHCWGGGGNGELGHGAGANVSTPVQVSGIDDAVRLSAASDNAGHTCVVRGSGDAYCFGYNGNGMLGDETTTQRLSPVRVHQDEAATLHGDSRLGGPVVGVSGGRYGTLAVHADGSMSAWGYGANGRLGTGRSDQEELPMAVCTAPRR